MKRYAALILTLALSLASASALAAKSPAAELLGSQAAACHLATHLQAYTDGWDGESPAFSKEDGCEDYGHVHCYGRRVSLWDTPKKGDHRVPYYAGTMDGRIGPGTEFQLTDVVFYRGTYYANIRIYIDGYIVVNSGFVNADYVGCDCESYDAMTEVPYYDSMESISPPETVQVSPGGEA